MSFDTNTSVHSRVINAFFDSSDAAKTAVEALVASGIPREHITQSGGDGAGHSTAAATETDKGFWESLKELFIPEDDRHVYAEGLQRGGYLVSVRADEANYTRVVDILDGEGTVDLDEREGQWRTEGWTGFSGAAPRTDAATGVGSLGTTSPGIETNYKTDTAARAAAFGRRDVDLGRTGVRGYVFDTTEDDQARRAQTDLDDRLSASSTGGVQQFSAATDSVKIREHMDVIASDGAKIGTVDHLEGPDTIKLAKNTSPDGQHHHVPFAWIDHVDQHVHLKKTTSEVKAAW